jgi:hypothetical protein
VGLTSTVGLLPAPAVSWTGSVAVIEAPLAKVKTTFATDWADQSFEVRSVSTIEGPTALKPTWTAELAGTGIGRLGVVTTLLDGAAAEVLAAALLEALVLLAVDELAAAALVLGALAVTVEVEGGPARPVKTDGATDVAVTPVRVSPAIPSLVRVSTSGALSPTL